jgi:predicted DCC family thiol-disulfide oxidoreductase YuxK
MFSVEPTLQTRLGAPDADLVVIYDGQCPFCSAYVKLARLKEAVGRIALLDARSHGIASTLRQEHGLDLNEGMLALYGGQAYYGHEAMTLLSSLSSRSGLLNRAVASVFRSKLLARTLYPLLKLGRAAALFTLGRGKIATG